MRLKYSSQDGVAAQTWGQCMKAYEQPLTAIDTKELTSMVTIINKIARWMIHKACMGCYGVENNAFREDTRVRSWISSPNQSLAQLHATAKSRWRLCKALDW